MDEKKNTGFEEDANKKYKDAEERNKKNTLADLKAVKDMKRKQVGGKLPKGKPVATFKPMTDEDRASIDKVLNDKKRNLVQEIKAHFQNSLVLKQMVIAQERFEAAIERGVEIKDEYGLVRQKADLEIEAQRNFIDLKFLRSSIKYQLEDLKQTWGVDEAKLETYFQAWFVDNKDMTLDLPKK